MAAEPAPHCLLFVRAPGAQVPPKVRERRRDELISLQQRIGESWAELQVGKEVDVMVVSARAFVCACMCTLVRMCVRVHRAEEAPNRA